METKLILIEGIPGSGKTTIAKKVEKLITDGGKNAQCYVEGQIHPADLAWLSYLKLDEYKKLLREYDQYAEIIKKNSIIEEDMVLVAYTHLGLYKAENALMTYLEDKEIFDGKLNIQEFLDVNIKRWQSFCKNAVEDNKVYIFECVFLQNHINELLAFNDVSQEFIIEYFKKLINIVQALNPTLIYLNQCDIRATINRIAKERLSPDSKMMPDWIDICTNYVESSIYGKKHKLQGFDGVIEYFYHRVKTEIAIMKQLSIDTVVVDNHLNDWDDMFKQISAHISAKL